MMNTEQNKTTLPLMRTVRKVKSTTVGLRGFADSVDHLLNAIEEFYPFLEKISEKTNQMNQTLSLNQRKKHY